MDSSTTGCTKSKKKVTINASLLPDYLRLQKGKNLEKMKKVRNSHLKKSLRISRIIKQTFRISKLFRIHMLRWFNRIKNKRNSRFRRESSLKLALLTVKLRTIRTVKCHLGRCNLLATPSLMIEEVALADLFKLMRIFLVIHSSETKVGKTHLEIESKSLTKSTKIII